MANVYLLCATAGLVFMVLSFALGWVGGHLHAGDAGVGHSVGHDVGHGAGHDGGHGAGHDGQDSDGSSHLPLLSPAVIATYVTGFGAFGLVFERLFGGVVWLHVPAAAVSGLVLGVGVAVVAVRIMGAFESSSTARESEAYGQAAEVTVAIPPDGFGEVAYVAGGARQALPARGEPGVSHRAGDRVRIVRIVGGTAQVRSISLPFGAENPPGT